jgi:RNA polymerase-binding transcription factor DksA
MNTEHFKEKLEAELKVLTKELNDLGEKDPTTGEWEATGKNLDVTTPMADSNEAADQLEELVEREGETSTLEARRNDVKDALAKIADNTYGICEVEGETIEEDRLEANPAARTCKAHM